MHVRLSETKREAGFVAFQCPKCRKSNATALITEVVLSGRFLGITGVHPRPSVHVGCNSCYAEFVSKVSVEEFLAMPREKRAKALRYHFDLSAALWAFLALTCWWAPVWGMIITILAVIWTRGGSAWARYPIYFGLALAIAIHMFFILAMITK